MSLFLIIYFIKNNKELKVINTSIIFIICITVINSISLLAHRLTLTSLISVFTIFASIIFLIAIVSVQRKITNLDLSKLDFSEVESIASMFYGCALLQTIYVEGNLDLTYLLIQNMPYYKPFDQNWALVGGNGTTYEDVGYVGSNIDKAVVDGLGGKPGYFTAI